MHVAIFLHILERIFETAILELHSQEADTLMLTINSYNNLVFIFLLNGFIILGLTISILVVFDDGGIGGFLDDVHSLKTNGVGLLHLVGLFCTTINLILHITNRGCFDRVLRHKVGSLNTYVHIDEFGGTSNSGIDGDIIIRLIAEGI